MKNWWKLLLLAIALNGCKKPYNPRVTTAPVNYLIVEGFINTSDTTKIKLSRAVNLASQTTTNPVIGAAVSVESDANLVFSLTETGNGNYILSSTMLDNSHKYRISIKTADNQTYLSDFEQPKVAPPIDSVGFTVSGKGIHIYASAHDVSNNTRYYRFEYSETWAFHSQYDSGWEALNGLIVARPPQDDIYHCYTTSKSSNIVLASSAKLTSDVIYQAPLTDIDSTSEKIETKYSIQLQEYPLSSDAFKFWSNLKKNTEQLGSIFDAQPSQISGNIHNSNNPEEVVIGYISAGTVQSKRVFINNDQLPSYFRPLYPYDCGLTSLLYVNQYGGNEVSQFLLGPTPLLIPVSDIESQTSFKPIGFKSSTKECVDCTIRGSKNPPDFWK